MKIYEVTWYDAHFSGESHSKKNIDSETPPWIIKTVGYYAGENKIDFKIAQEFHEGNEKYGHIMSIPHKMIISKKELAVN